MSRLEVRQDLLRLAEIETQGREWGESQDVGSSETRSSCTVRLHFALRLCSRFRVLRRAGRKGHQCGHAGRSVCDVGKCPRHGASIKTGRTVARRWHNRMDQRRRLPFRHDVGVEAGGFGDRRCADHVSGMRRRECRLRRQRAHRRNIAATGGATCIGTISSTT